MNRLYATLDEALHHPVHELRRTLSDLQFGAWPAGPAVGDQVEVCAV